MTNSEISDQFSLLSKLMDIHGENSFKASSYSTAAFNIDRMPLPIAQMDDAQLFSQKGIGESTGKKIRELLTTGKLRALEQMLEKTPPGILDMLEIKGLGPKKIAIIWKELGAESLGELEYACNENRLVTLKGFGAKTQESVLQNIAYFKQNLGFHLWKEAEGFAEVVITQLLQNYPGRLCSVTGDVRRQNETIEFIEIITDLDKGSLARQFESTEGALLLDEPGFLQVNVPNQPRVRFYSVATQDFYRKLFLTTGCLEFVEAFQSRYKIPDAPRSEDEIFAANGLAFIPPMLREGVGVLEALKNGPLPLLIQPDDIKGIIHSHSVWSDGKNTIEEMARAAIARGLQYLVLSDHSKSAFYANGLDVARIRAQHKEIDELNAKLAPFRIFKSIESDILSDGNLDYDNEVLSSFDLVIASVHSNLKMSQEKAMERVLNAVRNPYTTILGHPTGRLLLSRKGYPLDFKLLIETCAAHNVVIEINAHPRRLDLDWRWIRYVMDCGVMLSIDPDAHSIEGFNDTYYGVKIAQKGGLDAGHNLSSMPLAEFESFVQKQKSKAGR